MARKETIFPATHGNKARSFISYFAKFENARYLHVCEAAPSKRTDEQVGKLITYLIIDFINAQQNPL